MIGLTVEVPVRIESESNRSTGRHWAVRRRRFQQQKFAASVALMGRLVDREILKRLVAHVSNGGRVAVVLTRIAPRQLDTDNLTSGFKGIRDLVADALEVDDADRRIEWHYRQRRGQPKEYAAMIDIVVREEGE